GRAGRIRSSATSWERRLLGSDLRARARPLRRGPSRSPRATHEPMSPRTAAPRRTAFSRPAYERDLGAFIAEREEELYQHGAGLHDKLSLEPIYERHAALFDRSRVDALRRLLDAGGADEGHNRALFAVATDGLIER